MIIRIHDNTRTPGGNKGSSSNLIQYLEKENTDKDILDHVGFFSHTEDNISASEVERILDKNKGRLGKDDAKYFMLTVNPSLKELNHINSNQDHLKSYVKGVMDTYATNFNRTYKNGEKLKGEDLMYYAKIEHQRTYKFSNKKDRPELEHNAKIRLEIIKNLKDDAKVKELEKKYIRNSQGTPILEGNLKDGNNIHVHIVVHRYDKEQKFKLSPLSNQRSGKGILNGKEHEKGFNRDAFVQKCESQFDQMFNYERSRKESYNYNLNYSLLLYARRPEVLAKIIVKRAILESIEDKTIQKSLGMAISNPKKIPKKSLQLMEKEALKAVLKALNKTAYTNPVSAGIQIAKQTFRFVAKGISKSASI